MGDPLYHLTGGLNLSVLDRVVSFVFVPGEGCGASPSFVFAGSLPSSFTHTYSLVTHVRAVASRFIRWPHSSSPQAGSWIVKTFVHLFLYCEILCLCVSRIVHASFVLSSGFLMPSSPLGILFLSSGFGGVPSFFCLLEF